MNNPNSTALERFSAFKSAVNPTVPRKIEKLKNTNGKEAPISEYFGCMTFGLAQMREKLHKEAYQCLLRTLEQGKKLPKETADAIASAIKEWAVNKGVTHFCHWFQPMTGLTAEKHDAFISIQHAYHSELRVIERFTGSQLIQGEPDASSFPSGGMRSTFEARGYTAWDPSSPLFIIEEESGNTLCIPTVFFGYHGHALDNKTPLLRSIDAVSREGCEFLKLLGDVDAKRLHVTVGVEQEYFLIDKNLASLRPDVLMTGRTLLGAPSARGQQLEDHYFGSIPGRVKRYMQELEFELYKLGVPVKTRHNEVAPSQFELAPIFEDANIAADHNVLTMDVLKRMALKHGMICLLHEKPFAGINGSGKHNNWSIANDKGENLLEPGTTPHQNLRFLACLAVVLKAVYEHADMLRASIASPGNDHRLGANEAPPAIISVFLGQMLENILNSIEGGTALKATDQQIIDLGLSHIPDISKDYTDRNRTSPFAFTGNKFEFRAVGSSTHVALPISILNGAVASSFREAAGRLKELLKKKGTRDEAVMELIRQLCKETRNIRFEGNGYSKEWRAEAKKRGLPILSTSAEALSVMAREKSTRFLVDMKVFSPEEIASRYHVYVERYIKTLDIEFETLIMLVRGHVIPSLEKQLAQMGAAHNTILTAGLKKLHKERIAAVEKVFEDTLKNLNHLDKLLKKSYTISSEEKRLADVVETLIPASEQLRQAADYAEICIADDLWTLPKYSEMLFSNELT